MEYPSGSPGMPHQHTEQNIPMSYNVPPPYNDPGLVHLQSAIRFPHPEHNYNVPLPSGTMNADPRTYEAEQPPSGILANIDMDRVPGLSSVPGALASLTAIPLPSRVVPGTNIEISRELSPKCGYRELSATPPDGSFVHAPFTGDVSGIQLSPDITNPIRDCAGSRPLYERGRSPSYNLDHSVPSQSVVYTSHQLRDGGDVYHLHPERRTPRSWLPRVATFNPSRPPPPHHETYQNVVRPEFYTPTQQFQGLPTLHPGYYIAEQPIQYNNNSHHVAQRLPVTPPPHQTLQYNTLYQGYHQGSYNYDPMSRRHTFSLQNSHTGPISPSVPSTSHDPAVIDYEDNSKVHQWTIPENNLQQYNISPQL